MVRRSSPAAAPAPSGPTSWGRRRIAVNRVAGVVAAGLLVGLVGWGVTLLYLRVPVAVCLAAGVLAAAVWTVLRDVAPELPPPTEEPERGPHRRGAFADLAALEAQLADGLGDPERFADRLRPLLTGLAVDGLRQHHGLYWPAHRQRVQALDRPELWDLLTAPTGDGAADPARLERWVAAIEGLADHRRGPGPRPDIEPTEDPP